MNALCMHGCKGYKPPFVTTFVHALCLYLHRRHIEAAWGFIFAHKLLYFIICVLSVNNT